MARSLKKGPFADEHLLKHGHVVLQFSHKWLDIQLQFMMEEDMCLYM
jgi:ribosomal protein S19